MSDWLSMGVLFLCAFCALANGDSTAVAVYVTGAMLLSAKRDTP